MDDRKETKISPWPWRINQCITIYDTPEGRKCTNAPMVEDANGAFICKTAADVYDFLPMEETCRANAFLLSAAPELREELERIIRKTCVTCKGETLTAIQGTKSPCEDGRPCPYGLDGARKAIDKSYGKE